MSIRRVLVPLALGSLMALIAVSSAFANHPVPSLSHTGGAGFRVPIVPAFKPCVSSDSTHSGVPGPSCSSTAGGAKPVSALIKVGTGDIAWVQISLINPNTAGVDVALKGNATDVRCKVTNATAGCPVDTPNGDADSDYNPDSSPGPYTAPGSGQATAPTPLCTTSLAGCSVGADMTATAEIPPTQADGSAYGPGSITETRSVADRAFQATDHYNSKTGATCTTTKPSVGWAASDVTAPYCLATTTAKPFPVPVVCEPNGDPLEPPGSNCGVNTTANSLVPNAVKDGKRSVLEIGQIQIYDAGSNGVRELGTGTNDKIVGRQGIFIP